MLLINGMIYLNSNNKTIFIDKMSDVLLKQKNFSIPRNRKYRIGIDQSTTCTGIYIEDTNEDFSAILEIPRNKDLTKNMYFLELTQFLNYIFNERELDVVVYELPVPNMKQTTSYKTLTELKGKLDQWLASNITFCNVKTIGLYPQSWKSKVLNKEKGKGRSKIKKEIAIDLCELKPHLSQFLPKAVAKDLDAFDACGILTGYKELYYEDGWPKIFGYLEKRHYTEVYYRYVDVNDFQNDLRNTLYGIFGETLKVYKPIFKIYNDDYNMIKNFRMASSNDPFVITYLPDSSLTSLQWKFDFEIQQNKIMLAYIVRKGCFKSNELKLLDSLMPWHEEVEHAE